MNTTPSSTPTLRYRLTPEFAYSKGYNDATRSREPNLRAWPRIKRSRLLRACYEQGYVTGLEQMSARRAVA